MRLKWDVSDLEQNRDALRKEIRSLGAKKLKLEKEIDEVRDGLALMKVKVEEKKFSGVAKTYEDLVVMVASEVFDVSVEQMKSKARHRNITKARNYCISKLRNTTNLSLSSLGKIFSRDHATALNSIRVFANDVETDKSYLAKSVVADKIISNSTK